MQGYFSYPRRGDGKDVIIFGVDMSSSRNIDNKGKDILILQQLTKYLRLTLFSCEIPHSRKSLIPIFQEFSSSINKTFILSGRLGTRLSFSEV